MCSTEVSCKCPAEKYIWILVITRFIICMHFKLGFAFKKRIVEMNSAIYNSSLSFILIWNCSVMLLRLLNLKNEIMVLRNQGAGILL